MLDNGTKRRIDTARDILVGKLPDPKSQVEQITIALIYKFMDDMDKQSEELGGKAKFFTGKYAKYAWSKIFDPRVSGYELIGLYGEAIQRMNHNSNIPQLFRDIFKNAYLPYRDSETLKSFLKVIAEFEYDHSEKLGDAFEYLLSIMGSQGDAGQFRTPRHIIDFMVKVVDPCKNETILDPACGTAGFLISSFKHIQNKNRNKKDGKINLAPHEKKRLIENFSGYDISPDMVRLSLVNMYLHGFQNPKIYEYDTLTSEDKWQEVFDVILANPPFMSPKGGIKPHKRFSVQAKRSEVLFVDYMAEHLNPNGRAGIIVPEGIIFQSGTAYKKLRKMLIEQSLYAVVSLPAGVFNPYSGVKTSILLMDKTLAKRTKNILFVKVENDGFGLGAQRKPIPENDLPRVLDIILKCRQEISKGKEFIIKERDKTYAHIVAKEKIADTGEYNLSWGRYQVSTIGVNQKWPMVELGEICDIFNGSTPLRSNVEYWENGNIPWFTIDDIREQGRTIYSTKQKITDKALKETSVKLLPEKSVLLCCTASVGEYALAKIRLTTNQQFNGLVVKSEFCKKVIPEYLFWIASSFNKELIRLSGKTSFNFVSVGTLKKIKIPLPPLEIQEKIVAELDGYSKIINGAKQVVENYKPTIKIDPEWEMVEFKDVCVLEYGTGLPVKNRKGTKYPVMGSNGLAGYHDEYLIKGPAIIVGRKGSAGEVTWIGENCYPIDTTYYVKLKDKSYNFKFLYYALKEANLQNLKGGAGVPGLNRNDVYEKVQLPFPSPEIQEQIVAQIECEQNIVDKNKKLIEIFEAKIKDAINEVWGE